MLHFYEVTFWNQNRTEYRSNQFSETKKNRYVSFCHYEGGPLNRKVVIRSSTLSLLNLMLMYMFSRIPGKHKSTLRFLNIYLDRKDFKQSIN